MTWSTWWCFNADDGITLTTWDGEVASCHFSTIREVLKYLRSKHPNHDFKSERFMTYRGLAYAIKGRLN